MYYDEELAVTAEAPSSDTSSSASKYTRHTATLTNEVLTISSPKHVDLGIQDIHLYKGGLISKEISAGGSVIASTISNIMNDSFIGGVSSQAVRWVLEGGARTEGDVATGHTEGACLIHWFEDDAVWIFPSTYTTEWQFTKTLNFFDTVTQYQATPVAGTPVTANGAAIARDGSKFALFLGDQDQEDGVLGVRIFDGDLTSAHEQLLTAAKFEDTVTSATIIHSASILDRDHIWLGSTAGTVYYSSSGYVDDDVFSSVVIDADNLGTVSDINFVDEKNGIAIVATKGLYYTTDGGATWSKADNLPVADADVTEASSRVKMKSAEEWYVLAGENLYHTKNSDTTWTMVVRIPDGNGLFNNLQIAPEGSVFEYAVAHDSTKIYIQYINSGSYGIVPVKKTDSRTLSLMRSMRFAAPSQNNILGWRTGQAIKIEGIHGFRNGDMNLSVSYVRPGSDHTNTETYGISEEDIEPIMENAFEESYRSLIAMPTSEIVDDGNQGDLNNNYAN